MADSRREHIVKILLGIGSAMGKHFENCTEENFVFKLLSSNTVEENVFNGKNTKSDYLEKLTKLFDKLIAVNVALVGDYRPKYLTLEFGTLELHKNYVGVWYCDMETAENIKHFVVEVNISAIDKLTDEEYEIIESLGLDSYIDAALENEYSAALSFASLDSIERGYLYPCLNRFTQKLFKHWPYYTSDNEFEWATVLRVYSKMRVESKKRKNNE